MLQRSITDYRVGRFRILLETLPVIAAFIHYLLLLQQHDEQVGLGGSWDLIAFCRPAAVILWLVTIVGCVDSVADKSLPAPIRDTVSYQTIGKIPRVQGGNYFEFGDANELHYILIRGVDCPKPGQSFHTRATRATIRMTWTKDIRIEVVARDESMVEIADVFVINPDSADIDGELNLGLELLRQGLGWFDGSEFEDSARYEQTQADAKAKKIGLWSEDNPVPPWEFELTRQLQQADRLKF